MEELHDFSTALELLKEGHALQRDGWDDKRLRVQAQYPDEHSKMTRPYLYIEEPNGLRCPWAPSQSDIMASDWRLL